MRAATRWRRLVRARLAEVERLEPGRGPDGAGYWNARGRATRFAAVVGVTAEGDPLTARLRRAAPSGGTIIDVGAGTGRFALALAPRVAEVVAIDASRSMLGVLRRAARQQGVTNVRCVERRWEDVDLGPAGLVAPADVVVCSYVLPLIVEAEPFLDKIGAACAGRAFVAMNAMSADAVTDPLWRHFHGARRPPAPTYLDAVAILRDLGADPQVEVVEVRTRARYPDLAAAVRAYRDVLVVADTPAVRAELRWLLSSWLVAEAGGLRPPHRTTAMAIISWPGHAPGRVVTRPAASRGRPSLKPFTAIQTPRESS